MSDLVNMGMDCGDIMAMVDESYDDETGTFPITESDERAGVPEEIDDDITEEEYEDILTNDDATNPAGGESIVLKAAMDNTEASTEVEDEVMDIVMDDDEEEAELEESDIIEYDEEEDAEIAAMLDEDEEDALV